MRAFLGGAAALGALALASMLFACGGSDDSGSGGAATAAPASSDSSSSAGGGGAGPSTGPGCGDLSSDPKNCGVCGHDCLGGACVMAACQAVEIRTTEDDNVQSIAIDSTSIYWGDDTGVVQKGPKGMGSDAKLATLPSSVAHLEVRGNKLWGYDGTSGLSTIDTATGTVVNVLPATNLTSYFVLDDVDVYQKQTYSLSKMPLDGSTAVDIPTDTNNNILGFYSLNGLFTDGSQLYVPGHGYSGQGPATFVVPKNGAPAYIWIDQWSPTVLLFTSKLAVGASIDFMTGAAVFRTAPKAGGSPKQIAKGDNFEDMTVDDTNVYWSTKDGKIYRAPLAGGATTLLFTDPNGHAKYLLSDAAAIYFIDGNYKLSLLAK